MFTSTVHNISHPLCAEKADILLSNRKDIRHHTLTIYYASAFASATAFALAATSFSCTSPGACSYLANSYL